MPFWVKREGEHMQINTNRLFSLESGPCEFPEFRTGKASLIDTERLNHVIKAKVETLCRHSLSQGKRVGGEWKIANTSGAPGNSLGIQLTGPNAGLWHDRATGDGGDFIGLLMANRNLNFLDAVSEIERCLGISFRTGDTRSTRNPASFSSTRRSGKKSPLQPSFQLNRQELGRMAAAAHRLAFDPALIAQFVKARPEWTPDAVRDTALDGDLGYEDGKLLFGYRFGIKARWVDANGERIIRWLCGNACGECWRQSLLIRTTLLVYVCEGETDALTAISLGLEQSGDALVVGLPSASACLEPAPFQGKDIVLMVDPDPAGKRCAHKVRSLLGPVAASITSIGL